MSEQRLYGPDGGPRKPDRFSQCSKILRVLEDGKPHLVSEIHERAGTSRLNSRVSELRKRGYDIRSYHVPGERGARGYGYQLFPSLTERERSDRELGTLQSTATPRSVSEVVPRKSWEARISVDENGCWLWSGALTRGYGYVTYHSENWLLHRLLYTLVNGEVPNGYQLHHRCEVRACVNPDHVVPVTQLEHTAAHGGIPEALLDRAEQRRSATHCANGHEYTPENTRIKPINHGRGWQRVCRECSREGDRRRRATRKRGYPIESFHVAGKSGSEGYGYQLCTGGSPSGVSSDVEPADTPLVGAPVQMSLEAA